MRPFRYDGTFNQLEKYDMSLFLILKTLSSVFMLIKIYLFSREYADVFTTRLTKQINESMNLKF